MSTRARILAVAAAVSLTAVAPPSAHAIVNGDRAGDGRDFMAALLVNGSQFCGGSVIAPQLVMTAAHCVADGSAEGLSVSVGATDYRDGTEIDVTSVTVHPDYDDDPSADVAVLRLASSAPVSPITLSGPSDDGLEAPGSPAVVAGWGSQTPLVGQVPPLDSELYEVELTVVADDDPSCGTSSPANQVCAADFLEDSCQGDSGGPLFADLPGGEVQIGIVSSGIGCGVPGFAGYYTEVNGASIANFLAGFVG
jgi:secreted trypsin-like serine protease